MRGKSSLPPDGNLSLRSTPAHAGNCPALRNPGRNAAPRITPARAGKRRPSHVYSHPFWEHPLPMHGKDLLRSPGGRKERITLAHAGKRAAPPPRCPGAEDHPAHAGKRRRTAPLLSGTPDHPACAGKSRTGRCISSFRWDHPRVCGEKMQAVLDMSAREGSPPRVRGQVIIFITVRMGTRITPACAGKRPHCAFSPR